MKEIMLITTKGCAGCSIMRANINKALASTKKENIQYTEIDHKDLLDKNRKQYLAINPTDFPTVVFKRNHRIVRKEVGTRPVIVVLRWIDIDFK